MGLNIGSLLGGGLGFLVGGVPGAAIGAGLGGSLTAKEPSAPAVPDANSTALGQAEANIRVANNQALLDRYSQHNQYGDIAWNQGPNGQWQQTTTLNPQQQQIFDINTANRANAGYIAGDTALNSYRPYAMQGDVAQLVGQGNRLNSSLMSGLADAYGGRFDYSGVNPAPSPLNYYDSGTRYRTEQALYDRAKSRLDPQYQQAENDLQSRLAAQGITQGSEAYNREIGNLIRAKNDAYDTALTSAIRGGGDAMAQEFGIARDQYGSNLLGRQQGVNEANYLRNQPLFEATGIQNIQNSNFGNLNNLLNSGLNQYNAYNAASQGIAPTFSPYANNAMIGSTPYAQSVANQYQGNLNNYNAQAQTYNSSQGMNSNLLGMGLNYFLQR